MNNEMNIKFDMDYFATGIKEAVKEELSETVVAEIRETAVSTIVSEIREDVLLQMRATIEEETQRLVAELVQDLYETETITVGGGWGSKPTEYTLKEYISYLFSKEYEDNSIEKRVVRNYDRIISENVDGGIKKAMREMRENINKGIVGAFDEQLNTTLSQAVLDTLKNQDTYKQLLNNLANLV